VNYPDLIATLGNLSHRPTIRQAIVAAQPELANKIVSITEHSDSRDIRDDQIKAIGYSKTLPATFPTVFCITTNEGTAFGFTGI